MNNWLWFLVIAGLWTLVQTETSPAQSACQQGRLTASDGGPFQSFGSAVGVSGDTALVGACCFFDWPTYVFSFDPRTARWIETQLLMPSDLQPGEDTGRAVAIDGDVALIAAGHLHEDETGVFYGAVFVFRYNGSLWREEDELLASDSAFQDGFGVSVSISGEVIVIGAPGDDDNGTNAGSAYVFRYDPDIKEWVEEQKLLASDPPMGHGLGLSVAVFGDVAVIGAPASDDACPDDSTCNSGAAYVFRFDPKTATWSEQQKLLASDAASQDRFGSSVSISGESVLIGATQNGAPGPGSAYVFQFDLKSSQWIEEQKLLASDAQGGDQFGRAVAIDGERAVIGAWLHDDMGSSSGAAYVFGFDAESSTWIEQQKLLPEANAWTQFFGWSVAIDGDKAIAGAFGEDQQRGAAYVFDVALNCNCAHDLDADGNVGVSDLLSLLASWGSCPPKADCPADFDGNGNVGVSDLLALLANWGPCP